MQQWHFTENAENNLLRNANNEVKTKEKSVIIKKKPKDWEFKVWASDVLPGETVCVTGNCQALGKWEPEKCKPLEQGPDNIWHAKLTLERTDVYYRYCIVIIVEENEQVIVKRWETNLMPRKINFDNPEQIDTFGDYDNSTRIERGWLTKESLVQLQLYNNPLTLWKSRFNGRLVYIKVTPVNITRHNTSKTKNPSFTDALEESLSDTQDIDAPKYAYTTVASLTADNNAFQPQEQFGKEYNPNDILIFETRVLDLTNIAFLIDLYIYSSHANHSTDPPYHVGFSYLLPTVFLQSKGTAILPVTSMKQRPLGQISVTYVVIKPMEEDLCDFSVSYAKYWKNSWQGLDVGHRGTGNSFNQTKNCSELRENTIASIKTACAAGADMVEFDVQLSKDLVPVIYHDFHVCIALKRKKELVDSDMLTLPVKELTLEQLHFLKIYHVTEGQLKQQKFFDEDLEEHQPFPTLQQVLEVIQPDVGFNVEIKWGSVLNDGSFELEDYIDPNIYLDKILNVVLRHCGNRRILFSCFNPDVCSMLRLKQNKFPVMFLTQGQTVKYPNYLDPRCGSIKAGVQFATAVELLGLCVHTEDILRDTTQVRLVREAGLVIFCWGDDNNDPENIKLLKELGLHAVIYDKIDQFSPITNRTQESTFLLEARESQREMILLHANSLESTNYEDEESPRVSKTQEQQSFFNHDKAREKLSGHISTASSISSLQTCGSSCCSTCGHKNIEH